MRLLLVAPPAGAEAWTASLAEAGVETVAHRTEDGAGAAAALRDPLDLVLAWDDERGERAASILSAARAEGATVPVAVVAHPEAEVGVERALRQGAAAVLDRDRPGRFPAEVGRVLEQEWLSTAMALTGRIAHDLNNLLAPIPLAVQLLEKVAAPSDARNQLDSVRIATRRSMDGVKELSELLAAEGPVALPVRAKHLLALAPRCWRLLEVGPPTILTDYPGDLEVVRVDPVRVLQALWCLARRALDAGAGTAGGAGTLLFAGRNLAGEGPEAAGVELLVAWSVGEGVDERFGKGSEPVRAPEPRDRLDAVLEVLAAEGGALSVVDAGPGRGGFAVRFPVGRSSRGRGGVAPPQGARQAAPAGERGPAGGPRGREAARRVLVIDAGEAARRTAREALEAAGWEVLTAADGTEGVAVYAANLDSVGAVVVDVSLPRMDGVATMRALRRIGEQAKIVLTTGGDWDPRRLESGDHRPDAVLSKPYDPEALLEALVRSG